VASEARAAATVALAPEAAQALWTSVRRWPTFVEGFARPLEERGGWPEPGSTLVWESIPGGRGRVTEKIRENEPARLVTEVFEERMSATQTVTFAEDAEGARVEVLLEYELTERGPIAWLAGLFFVRRALRDSTVRSLRRFAVEAAEEASYE